jgi:hypothetical protein
MLGDTEVVFSDRRSLNPEVRVNINPGSGKVVIEAYTEKAAIAMPVGRDLIAPHFMQIRFDKPMDPRSFFFNDGSGFIDSGLDSSGIPLRRFNNIEITGASSLYPYTTNRYEGYFLPPTLSVNGKILSFWFDSSTDFDGSNDPLESLRDFRYNDINLTLTLDGQIKDRNGVGLERSYSVDFYFEHFEEGDGTLIPPGVQFYCMVVNGLGDNVSDDIMNKTNFSGENFMIIKTDPAGSFAGNNFVFDSASHNVFSRGDNNDIYLAMLAGYHGAYLPRAFKIMEKVDGSSSFAYAGQEAELVTDPNITIPITREFEKHLERKGRSEDAVYPVVVVKYRLMPRPSGSHTVYLSCWPLQKDAPSQTTPETGLCPDNPGISPGPGLDHPFGFDDSSNPGRFIIYYDIP